MNKRKQDRRVKDRRKPKRGVNVRINDEVVNRAIEKRFSNVTLGEKIH